MMPTHATISSRRPAPTMARRIGRVAGQVWSAYWDWRARKATARILYSLDTRTLRDIGLTPGEIESVVYGRPGDRQQCYRDGWHRGGRI